MPIKDALDDSHPRKDPFREHTIRRVPGLLRATTFIRSIALESWRGLFDAVGATLIEGDFESLDARLNDGVPMEIVEALEFIHAYTGDGFELLLGLLDAASINDKGLKGEQPVNDLLASFWARSQTDPRLRRIVVVAQLEAAVREGTRASHRYVGDADQRLVWSTKAESMLKTMLAEGFKSSGLTRTVQLDIQPQGERVSVYVLRGGRKHRVVRMDDTSGESAPDDIRATQCDLVHLDLREARLEILPSEQRLAERYAQAFGEALGRGAGFFAVEQSFELRALLATNRASLAAEGRPDVQISLERVEWEPRSGARMTARAENCFQLLEHELKHPGAQRVLLARLGFRFAKTGHRVGVTLRPPNSIRCSRESDLDEIHELLKQLGLLGPSDLARFWEFSARARPTLHWQRALKSGFKDAVAKKWLTKELVASAPHPAYSAADGAVRKLEGLDGVVVGVEDSVPPRRVQEDDFEVYALHRERYADLLCSTLRLEQTCPPELPSGILELGRRTFRVQVVRVFLALAPIGDMALVTTVVRARAQGDRPVLLAPPEHYDQGGLEVVPFREWRPPFGELVEHFFDRLGLREEMTLEEAAGNARLVVRPDGVFLDQKKLILTAQQVQLVQLIIAYPATLSTKKLGEKLRSAGEYKTSGEEIARKTKEKLCAEIGRALALDPRSHETKATEILKNERGRGYQFLVPARDLTPKT